MRGDERRRQLLDVASALLDEQGATAVTMERLAERADVSKALPYKHFDNADAVLVALYQRASVRLGRQVWTALEEAGPGVDLVAVYVSSFLDGIVETGPTLRALSGPGSTIPAISDPDRVGPRFTARVLERFFGLDPSVARSLGGLIQGAMVGAAETLLSDRGSRAFLFDALTKTVRALADDRRSGPR
jgi:AcrR family transcriptional regulator